MRYLADRTSRSGVVAGVARGVERLHRLVRRPRRGFGQLFLYRLGVGIGEAGGVAPSYALIADYFPPERRARALAIFSLGIPIGLAGGTFIGAYIAHAIDWRAAFSIMGAGRDPARAVPAAVRPRRPQASGSGAAAPLRNVFPSLARKPAFWLLAFAAACSSLSGYGLALWTPSVLMRSFGLDL